MLHKTTFLMVMFVIGLVLVTIAVLVGVIVELNKTPTTFGLLTTTSTTSTTMATGNCGSTSITWKGYIWCVRNALNSGPGPNDWVTSNVWLDNSGWLHLRITNTSGAWTSAELYTINRFTFGTFQWQVEGQLDILDRKVVLGFFTYGPPVAGIDGTNEIDIEFARWGHNTSIAPNLFYTVWPASVNDSRNYTSVFFNQTTPYTTHRMTWSSTAVSMKSLYGFYSDDTNLFYSWQTPANFVTAVPQATAPIHINLWVFLDGTTDRSPSDGNPVEVIIHDFIYTKPTASLTTSGVAVVTSLTSILGLVDIVTILLYAFSI